MTLPTLGWVAKLGPNRAKTWSFSQAKYGAQTGAEYDAGNGILKSGQYVTGNNPTDANQTADSLFAQTWVQHFTQTFGTASKGGLTYGTSSSINMSGVTNPAPQACYQSVRYATSPLSYTLPNLTAGASYKVRLHFAEIYYNSAGSRTFNVSINGSQVLSSFDVFATAGAKNKAIVEEFTTSADSNGKITIAMTLLKDCPDICAIEVK